MSPGSGRLRARLERMLVGALCVSAAACAGPGEPDTLPPGRAAIQALVVEEGGRAELVLRERGGVWRDLAGARLTRTGDAVRLTLVLEPLVGRPPAVDVPAAREADGVRLAFDLRGASRIEIDGGGEAHLLWRKGRLFLPE